MCVMQEDANRGKPNWEHLADELHVLLTVEDTENRAAAKLARAVDEVKRLLIPVSHPHLLLHQMPPTKGPEVLGSFATGIATELNQIIETRS